MTAMNAARGHRVPPAEDQPAASEPLDFSLPFALSNRWLAACALILVLLGATIGFAYKRFTTLQLADVYQASNTEHAQLLINNLFTAFRAHITRDSTRTAEQLRDDLFTALIAAAVRSHVQATNIVGVKIYDVSGLTVFSTDRRDIGATRGNEPFGRARLGGIASELIRRDADSPHEEATFDRDLIVTYMAARNESGAVEGVLQIFSDATRFVKEIERQTRIIYLTAGTLAWGGFFIIVLLVRRVRRLVVTQHRQILSSHLDVVEQNTRLQLEIERRVAAESQALKQARLATLGKLTATVSHEMRNPLGTLRNSLFTIEKRSRDAGLGLGGAFERCERSIKRCDQIITDLLGYAKPCEPQVRRIELDPWVASVINEQPARENIAVVVSACSRGWAEIDEDQFRRAIINLFENACDAVKLGPGAGRVTIRTSMNAGRLVIEIVDSGGGIPAQAQAKLFEPLFTTKSFGVGLGLATVRNIVERHGGTVALVNNPGGPGATARILMPVARRAEPPARDHG